MSKQSHGARSARQKTAKPAKVRDIYVPRPFKGLADEAEWVALRELVPAATAPLKLTEEYAAKYGDRQITLSTILPMAWPALTKPDGRILLGLQRHERSGDVNRDLTVALLRALESEPGNQVVVPPLPGEGPRLADVIVNAPLEITMHEGFEYWLDDDAERDAGVAASLDAANASIFPTVRMQSAHAAYWCRVPDRAHVRWVLGDEEDTALNALARLAGSGQIKLTDETRFAGMFRAHGLLVPVWDLPRDTESDEWETPLASFKDRYEAAKENTDSLSSDERKARAGLVGRQVTLR